MQGCEFVVIWLYKLHEMLTHHVGIRAAERTFKISVNDSLFRHFFLQVVVDKLRVVLGANACKARPLCLWDSQLFKSVFNVFGNIFPLALHFCIWAHVSCDFIDIEA